MKACLAIFALIAVSAAAQARPEFWDDYVKHYGIKDGSTLYKTKCQTCHTSRPPQRNDYGRAVRTAYRNAKPGQKMPDVFKAVEDLDSDKDGAKNIDEIKADSLPGDATSKPVKKQDMSFLLPLIGVFGLAGFSASKRRSGS